MGVETVETQKFIRKPLYVDAVRVTQENFDAVAAWCQGEITQEVRGTGTPKPCIKVRVQYPKNPRQTQAFVGDWVLYTERGYKVYTNKAFRLAFDAVEYQYTPTPISGDEEAPGETDDGGFVLEPPPTPIDEHTTPQGEPHEYVEATPENIAQAVEENEQARMAEGAREFAEEDREIAESMIAPEPQPEPVPEDTTAGKRVLSVEEQRQMGPDAVREMVRGGDVILAQDLAESA